MSNSGKTGTIASHYIDGFKVQEIARLHGWSETAVRIRLLRARRAVERRLSCSQHSHLHGLAEKAKKALADVSDLDLFQAQVA